MDDLAPLGATGTGFYRLTYRTDGTLHWFIHYPRVRTLGYEDFTPMGFEFCIICTVSAH